MNLAPADKMAIFVDVQTTDNVIQKKSDLIYYH